MKKVALCFLFLIKGILGFALGIYESHNFDKVLIKNDWGDLSVRLSGTSRKDNGKTVVGNPYELIFLFTINSNYYTNAEILNITTSIEGVDENRFSLESEKNQLILINNGNGFEKFSEDEYIVSIWGRPFNVKYKDQKLKFHIRLISKDEIIEEKFVVELKLHSNKRIGIHFLERVKDV